LKNILEI